MIRYTTPTHVFELVDVDLSHVSKILVIYAQLDDGEHKIILEKTDRDVVKNENKIEVFLSQEETALFDSGKCACIQIRIKMNDGSVLSSGIMRVRIEASLNEEVL